MAENEDPPGTPDPEREPATVEDSPTATRPVVPAETADAPILKTRWRDRAWTFRAMIAVALASLVIGGIVGGVVVAAASDDDHGHHRMGPWGPGGPMGGPGWRGHGPRFKDGGPKWRWQEGPQPPQLTPYGGTQPNATPTPAPGTPSPPS